MTSATGVQESYSSIYAHLSEKHATELAQYVQIMQANRKGNQS